MLIEFIHIVSKAKLEHTQIGPSPKQNWTEFIHIVFKANLKHTHTNL
jgi:hypothetical protein